MTKHRRGRRGGTRLDPRPYLRRPASEMAAAYWAFIACMLAPDHFFWLCGWIFVALPVRVWFARPPFTAAGGGVEAAA